MASQPPSQLRAQTGQDVLFAGSEQHAASGVCEVELVLDNSDGRVGVPRSELSVMRRLDRAGDSDYLLNRQSVRRLDVRDLLAEAGLGRELHCIIAQGTVDQVLLARPDERRGLVEEAAGLGKFKRRRQRAEAKLARVAADLERAGDLERELRARLRPLELQATAAERAEVLGRQIAEAAPAPARIGAGRDPPCARRAREPSWRPRAPSATRPRRAWPRSAARRAQAEDGARAHPRRAGGVPQRTASPWRPPSSASARAATRWRSAWATSRPRRRASASSPSGSAAEAASLAAAGRRRRSQAAERLSAAEAVAGAGRRGRARDRRCARGRRAARRRSRARRRPPS